MKLNESHRYLSWQQKPDTSPDDSDINLLSVERMVQMVQEIQEGDVSLWDSLGAEYSHQKAAAEKSLLRKAFSPAPEKGLHSRLFGSLFEHLVRKLVEDLVAEEKEPIYDYLPPLETAEWFQRLASGQDIVRHPFGTYSLTNNFRVPDGLLMPKHPGYRPIVWLESTTRTTVQSMMDTYRHFKTFKEQFGKSMQVDLQFLVPFRWKEEDHMLDLLFPEKIITEVPIARAYLEALTNKIIAEAAAEDVA